MRDPNLCCLRKLFEWHLCEKKDTWGRNLYFARLATSLIFFNSFVHCVRLPSLKSNGPCVQRKGWKGDGGEEEVPHTFKEKKQKEEGKRVEGEERGSLNWDHNEIFWGAICQAGFFKQCCHFSARTTCQTFHQNTPDYLLYVVFVYWGITFSRAVKKVPSERDVPNGKRIFACEIGLQICHICGFSCYRICQLTALGLIMFFFPSTQPKIASCRRTSPCWWVSLWRWRFSSLSRPPPSRSSGERAGRQGCTPCPTWVSNCTKNIN